eukprot:5864458-Ditylum_brightwellii.AAC.1
MPPRKYGSFIENSVVAILYLSKSPWRGVVARSLQNGLDSESAYRILQNTIQYGTLAHILQNKIRYKTDSNVTHIHWNVRYPPDAYS